jgi:RNA polymerase sigma-70 factor (family 1)
MKVVHLYTDEELVCRLQQGDRAAFENIYKRYWPLLYTIAFRRLFDKERAEDVLQEVFARLWVKREGLAIHHLKAYLSGMVRYEVIRLLTRTPAATVFFEPFESLLLEAETPDEKIIAKELYEWVFRYADTLPPKKKEIFLLHIGYKYSTKEIAEKLEISQKTVQNQLGSALQGLRTGLTPLILAILSSRL